MQSQTEERPPAWRPFLTEHSSRKFLLPPRCSVKARHLTGSPKCLCDSDALTLQLMEPECQVSRLFFLVKITHRAIKFKY